jgi:colicin import membrane protein
MKYPSIHLATAASLMLHCMFIAALMLTAKKQSRYVMPSPYTVRIVTQTSASKTAHVAKPLEVEKPAAPEKIAPPAKVEKTAVVEPPKTRVEVKPKTAPAKEKPKKEEPLHELKKPALVEKKILKADPAVLAKQEKQVESRISQMMVKKRIADILKNRAVVDIKKSFQEPPKKSVTDDGKTADKAVNQPGEHPGGADLGGTIVSEYLSSVVTHVRSNWAFPDSSVKDLSAVVAFTVKTDGKIEKLSLEQSSGNALFDRSVINAINKSLPMPRPPFELDVGIRFYP